MRRKDDDDEDEESFTLQISLTSTLTWSLEKLIIVLLAKSHSKLTDPHPLGLEASPWGPAVWILIDSR